MLCLKLKNASKNAQEWQSAHKSVKEESLTDWMLYWISKECPDKVIYSDFNRSEEGRDSGADWDWLFLSDNDAVYLRIQAKRIAEGSNLKALKYKDNTRSQMDLLLDSSEDAGAHPMYAFYSSGETVNTACRQCSSADHGVFLCNAYIVENEFLALKVPATRVNLLAVSYPLPCIACCPQANGSRSTVEFFLWLLDPRGAGFSTERPRVRSKGEKGYLSSLPAWAKALIPPELGSSLRFPEGWFRRYGDYFQDSRGLLVFDRRSSKN
jgi:hypothetical protein